MSASTAATHLARLKDIAILGSVLLLSGCRDSETPKVTEATIIAFVSPDQIVGTWKVSRANPVPEFIGMNVTFTEDGEVFSYDKAGNRIDNTDADSKVTWKHLDRKSGGTIIWTESKTILGKMITTRFDTFQGIYALEIKGDTMSWYPFSKLPVNEDAPMDTADYTFTRTDPAITDPTTDH